MARQWRFYYGSHNHAVTHCEAKITWLHERPGHLAGTWAIGCSLRSSLPSRAETPRRRQRKWCTKWSRFEIRDFSSMQSSALRLHAQSNVHKLAVKAWLCLSTPVVQWLQGTPEDDQLLHGAVPQLEQWLRAWRYAKNPTSLRAAEAIQGTEAFLAGSKSPETVAVASRKALRSMYEIMAEVVMEKKRAALRRACAICIMIDDRDAYRLCRYRCTLDETGAASDHVESMSQPGAGVSAPSGDSEVGGKNADAARAKALVREGLLFALRRGGETPGASMET